MHGLMPEAHAARLDRTNRDDVRDTGRFSRGTLGWRAGSGRRRIV
jgi:hypothetical protein